MGFIITSFCCFSSPVRRCVGVAFALSNRSYLQNSFLTRGFRTRERDGINVLWSPSLPLWLCACFGRLFHRVMRRDSARATLSFPRLLNDHFNHFLLLTIK